MAGHDRTESRANLSKVWCDLGHDGCREGDEATGGEAEDDDEDDDSGGVLDWDPDGQDENGGDGIDEDHGVVSTVVVSEKTRKDTTEDAVHGQLLLVNEARISAHLAALRIARR